MYTLINKVIGPFFLPSALDGEFFIKKIEDAIQSNPIAAKDFKLNNNEWQSRFRLWFKKFNQYSHFTPMGREAFRTTVAASVNRVVNLLGFYTKHKIYELSDEEAFKKVKKMIFIVGNYRTGTTFLHRLLAADPRAIVFQQWMLATDGLNVTSYKQVLNHERVLDSSIPNPWTDVAEESGKLFFNTHEFKFNMAEEDGLYWGSDFFLVPGFEMWEMRLFPNRKELYSFMDETNAVFEDFFNVRLKLTLKCWLHERSPIWTVFNANGNDHHVVLKASFYNLRLDLLKKQFPQAIMVAAHRNQLDMVRSYSNLVASSSTLYLKSGFTFDEVVPNVVDSLELHAKSLVKYKDLLDVNLNFKNDLTRDGLSGTAKILNKAGISFNETVLEKYTHEIARTTMANMEAKKFEKLKYGPQKELVDISVGCDLKKEVEKRTAFAEYEDAFKAYIV